MFQKKTLIAIFSFVYINFNSQEKPNILWLVCEDQSLFFSSYFDSIAITPNLDELASNGIDKRHAEYIQHNKCKIIGYESNNHRLALELRDNGILQKIIDNEIS